MSAALRPPPPAAPEPPAATTVPAAPAAAGWPPLPPATTAPPAEPPAATGSPPVPPLPTGAEPPPPVAGMTEPPEPPEPAADPAAPTMTEDVPALLTNVLGASPCEQLRLMNAPRQAEERTVVRFIPRPRVKDTLTRSTFRKIGVDRNRACEARGKLDPQNGEITPCLSSWCQPARGSDSGAFEASAAASTLRFVMPCA